MAQEPGNDKTPEQRAEWRTDKLAKELALTEAQTSQVNALNLESVKKNDAIRNDAALTPEQKKAAWKANHETEKAQLDKILTSEQKAKLQADREQWKAEGKQRAEKWKNTTPEQRAQFRTDQMAKSVTLTDDQKAKLTAMNLASAQKSEAIRKDDKLTPEQKKTAMQENRASEKAQMAQVLTAEQLATLKAQKPQHHGKPCDKKAAAPSK